MDKMQNFSDASEDEDDKVSNSSTNFIGSVSVFLNLNFCFPADSPDILE